MLTHGHADHVGDAVEISKQTGAPVITNYDLCMWLAGKGLEKFDPMNTGGTTEQGGFTVTLVRADHSSGDMQDGMPVYLGNPCGAIVAAAGEPTIYHLGDTDIFSDMALIAEIHRPKIAFVPIGDRFTMSPKTAALAVNRFLKVETRRAVSLRQLSDHREECRQICRRDEGQRHQSDRTRKGQGIRGIEFRSSR